MQSTSLAALLHQTWEHFFSVELDKKSGSEISCEGQESMGSIESPRACSTSWSANKDERVLRLLAKTKPTSRLSPPPLPLHLPRSSTNKIGSKDLDSFSIVTLLFLQSVTKTWETTKFDGNSSFGKLRGISLHLLLFQRINWRYKETVKTESFLLIDLMSQTRTLCRSSNQFTNLCIRWNCIKISYQLSANFLQWIFLSFEEKVPSWLQYVSRNNFKLHPLYTTGFKIILI